MTNLQILHVHRVTVQAVGWTAAVMLLSHIGYQQQADKLEKALDKCMYTEKKLVLTGRDTGCTGAEFADYVMETIKSM